MRRLCWVDAWRSASADALCSAEFPLKNTDSAVSFHTTTHILSPRVLKPDHLSELRPAPDLSSHSHSEAIYGTRPTTPKNLPSCPHKSKIADAVPNLSIPSAAPCGTRRIVPSLPLPDVTSRACSSNPVTQLVRLDRRWKKRREIHYVTACQLLVMWL